MNTAGADGNWPKKSTSSMWPGENAMEWVGTLSLDYSAAAAPPEQAGVDAGGHRRVARTSLFSNPSPPAASRIGKENKKQQRNTCEHPQSRFYFPHLARNQLAQRV